MFVCFSWGIRSWTAQTNELPIRPPRDIIGALCCTDDGPNSPSKKSNRTSERSTVSELIRSRKYQRSKSMTADGTLNYLLLVIVGILNTPASFCQNDRRITVNISIAA
jgi:hypothetical protein